MVSEIYSNMVYFSDLLPKRCPKTFKGLIEVLEKYGVTYGLLKGTKDIWCRDYMPIQTIGNRFVLFRYEPDYLLDSDRLGIKQQLQIIRLLSDTLARHIWKIPEASRLMVAMSFTADAKLS